MEGIIRAISTVTKGSITQVSEPTAKCGYKAEAHCTAASHVGIAHDEYIHSLTVLKVRGKWIIGQEQQAQLDQAACLRSYQRKVAMDNELGVVVDRKERRKSLDLCYPERLSRPVFAAATVAVPARNP